MGVGIQENTFNHNLSVYPNPTTGDFTVTCETVIESIELYDMMGKKLFSVMPKAQTAQIKENLSKGVYFYRVMLQDNSMRSGKIVVQ